MGIGRAREEVASQRRRVRESLCVCTSQARPVVLAQAGWMVLIVAPYHQTALANKHVAYTPKTLPPIHTSGRGADLGADYARWRVG